MGKLTRDEVAARAGIRPDTLSAYVSRGQAPAPDRRFGFPLWDERAVQAWLENRAGQGSRSTQRARKRAREREAARKADA